MKKVLRLISLCIVVMTVLNFTSCKNGSSKKEESNSKFSDNSVDLRGRTITVAVYSEDTIPKEDDSSIKDESSKLLNKVKLSREKEVESKFNCKIEWKVITDNEGSKLLLNMKAGKYYADIIYLTPVLGAFDMVREGLIAPLDKYIDYNSGLYSTIIQSGSEWKGQHYGITPVNDISNYFYNYNKTMIASEGLPDPHDLMQKGQWTWEAFLDIAKKTTKDTNGDGVIDCWGLASSYPLVYTGFIYSNNGDYIKDNGGKFELSLNTKEAKEALGFVTDLYKTNKVVNDSMLSDGKTSQLFKSNKAAFSTYRTYQDCGFEEGKVCIPKGPSASGYISGTGAGRFYAIPSSVEDIQSIAKVMADLFSYADTTKDEYFDFSNANIEQLSSDLYKNLTENLIYSWFTDDSKVYQDSLHNIYFDLLKNDKSVDEAINAQENVILNNLNLLNQQTQ